MMPEKKLRLLVVDDEKDTCEFIKRIFRKKGFLAYGASSGREALTLAKKTKPDIALIDLYLSKKMSGLNVLGALKKVVPHCLPAMITWDTTQEKVNQAKKLGAACYFSKPLTVKGLERGVQKLAKRIREGGKRRG